MRIAKWMGLAVVILGMVPMNGTPANDGTKNPCADDVAKYCKDVTPGGDRLVRCLKQHERELSPECKASQEKARARATEAHDACADDVQKLCKEVTPGGGRIIRCLRDKSTSLSPECRDKLTAEKKPN